jgi:Flp pilus assembly protein TadB
MSTDRVPAPDARQPGLLAMIGEVVDLIAGLGVLVLPLLVTALPGVILFFVLPGVLLLAVAAIPVALFAAIAVPSYLLARSVGRRRRRRVG